MPDGWGEVEVMPLDINIARGGSDNTLNYSNSDSMNLSDSGWAWRECPSVVVTCSVLHQLGQCQSESISHQILHALQSIICHIYHQFAKTKTFQICFSEPVLIDVKNTIKPRIVKSK